MDVADWRLSYDKSADLLLGKVSEPPGGVVLSRRRPHGQNSALGRQLRQGVAAMGCHKQDHGQVQ
eukprot:3567524-Heterocapsa_arctica.AAC.1